MRNLALLALFCLHSSTSLADEKACNPIEVKETEVNVKNVVAKPLPMGSKLLVVEPTGSVKLFNSKGEVEKQAGLQDTVSITPFEINNRIVITGAKKVHVLKSSNLERTTTIDLPSNPIAAAEVGEQLFGVSFRTGDVVIYDTAGSKKFEVSGIRPHDKFPPFHSSGREIVIIGQNSIKYVKNDSDIIFDTMITAGAGHGNLVAVGDDKGRIQILDIAKKKTKILNLSGGIKNILWTTGGFLVFSSNGKLTMIKSGETKSLSEVSFSELHRNTGSNQTFAFASNGEIYQVVDSTLVKTKLKGAYDSIFSWGKDFVTYSSGSFQVLDAEGNLLEQRSFAIPNSLGMNQLQQNTFVAPGNPFRTITLAKNTKCKN